MAAYLVDTGVLLRHLRGQRNAVRLLAGLAKMGRLSVSAITRLEVHAGMRPDERHATNKLLSRFVTHDVNREVADRAGDLVREQHDRSLPISVPDAIVAATALTYGLTLVTLNRADFEGIPGLSLAHAPEDVSP